MVLVVSGEDHKGKPCKFYMDGYLKNTLDVSKRRVEKNWDYVCIVSGIPGSGKSTFARTIARYCCPWFNEKYIAFTDEEFIRITSTCENNSAVILDESFQSLNARMTMSKSFLRIINHLQIIRQKNLYVILCLPNFFDLSKGVAVFRASHLFITYASADGMRGKFLAFGRDEKRRLYVKGGKFMNYNAVKANFMGRYTTNENIVKEKVYERMKLKHLLLEQQKLEKKSAKPDRDAIILNLRYQEKKTMQQIAKICGLTDGAVSKIITKHQERAKNPKIY